ncbi:OLC1v1002348C1 [Oldenlandia corymbosa var. corymbosa]|uniref:OLC1v1002348C1 n=1 Tax=Oldenlandia corymbosa var. corymbosa TaxID=529605 RepID=A0AAV1D7H8_OLDCO|nr:OLC1v1002348C1 [Oldenlandia corymbosa var. corymbosa]
MHEYKYEELEEATENFSNSRLIGKGSHGFVYKGILKETRVHQGQGHDLVAIKKQSLGLQKLGDNSKLENEARILSSISQNNPYLVNLVGISHDSGNNNNRVLIMEFMPNRTLHELLHGGTNHEPPSWLKRAQIALQIAKSVRFLHESKPPIVHRDIKSANVLFDSHWNARLADFGLAIRLNHDSLNRQMDSLIRPAGTIGYIDPSYVVPSKLSTKIDVFSFGVLLLEIISGEKVIDVRRSPSSIVEWAIPIIQNADQMLEICDERVQIPRFFEGMVRNMIGIAGKCVMDDEDGRPSMGEIVMELENCIVEPLRFPAWMHYLRGFIQRKLVITSKNKTADGANSTRSICAAHHQENNNVGVDPVSRGKLMLREILADIS